MIKMRFVHMRVTSSEDFLVRTGIPLGIA